MKSVQIERTSILTSRLGLGTSSLHHLKTSAARRLLLAEAWDLGIRYFDTAPLYGHGMAEKELGLFMRGRRSNAIVATKFGIVPNEWLGRLPMLMYAQKLAGRALKRMAMRPMSAPRRDYSAQYLRKSVDRSLRLLASDHIDVLYLHEPTLDLLESADELIVALSGLQRLGKVRYVGISGTLQECTSITARYAELGTVWQIDVGSRTQTDLPRGHGERGSQVTFGHLRNASEQGIERSLLEAVRINPAGVILFSSRKAAHIANIADTLAAVEG